MENLLSNIFKYALKESRVYIDISETEKEIFVSFKNISAYELNIPVDELMERFKRGDESRSSEGNGLGLAIAKSLMEIQEGILDISIDGDLFKAEIRLSKYE
jgi:signal transduction histidine kinase